MKEFSDWKVVPGESVARQRKVLVGKMSLGGKTRKKRRAEPRTGRWKLNEETSHALSEEGDGWAVISKVVREKAKKVAGWHWEGKKRTGKHGGGVRKYNTT